MRVLEFLYTHAPTLQEDSTLQDAIDKLDLYQVTLLPVLNEQDRVIGIITESMVFQILFEGFGEMVRSADSEGVPSENQGQRIASVFASQAELARQRARTPITAWMNPNPPVLNEHDPIEHAVVVMLKHGLDTLPVEGEGRFVGTIRLVDCCQALLES